MKKHYFVTLNPTKESHVNDQQIRSMIEQHLQNHHGYDWRDMHEVVENVERCGDLAGKLRDSEMAAEYNNANNGMKLGDLERTIERLKAEVKEKRTKNAGLWGAAFALSCVAMLIGFAGLHLEPGSLGFCCGLVAIVQGAAASMVSADVLSKGHNDDDKHASNVESLC